MSSRPRKAVRLYLRTDDPVELLLDEALTAMAAGNPSGRTGAARKLLLVGWLAVCGNDPRPIVERLRIPSVRSVGVMDYFLHGSGKNGASGPGADSQTTAGQATATTPVKAAYPVSDDLALQTPEALRSPDDKVSTGTRQTAQSFDVRQLPKMGNAQRRSKATDA